MNANTFIRWVVLVAALVSTAYAEHHLGVWVGWNSWVASVIPAVSDLYLIYATRTGRDVAPAVSVVIGLSAANYMCTAPMDPVRTPISVAVSALAPLVLWRLHASEHAEPADPELNLLHGPFLSEEEAAEVIAKFDDPDAKYADRDPHSEFCNGQCGMTPLECRTCDAATDAELTAHADEPDPQSEPVVDEDPKPSERLSDAEAKRKAEDAYAYGISAAKAAPDVTRSKATVYRWYREFEEAGVKRLVTA